MRRFYESLAMSEHEILNDVVIAVVVGSSLRGVDVVTVLSSTIAAHVVFTSC